MSRLRCWMFCPRFGGVHLLAMMLGAILGIMLPGCAGTAATVAAVAKAAAPFLPPPWNIVAGGVGIVAAFTASHFANKSMSATLAEAGQPSPIIKTLASRKWLFGLVAAGVAFGNAVGIWNLAPEQVWTMIAGLGIPAIAEGIKDAGANRSA